MTDTLPYAWYTDVEVFDREREGLFERSWQYAGHMGDLPEPGSYFTLHAGSVPLVVVRDREDELRAFVNVCRHRGAEVVSGSGPCSTLQCHYHAWTYALDGTLRAAPRSDADPGFDRDALGLRPAQVDTWGPFVFVNADHEAAPLSRNPGNAAGPGPRRGPRRGRAHLSHPRRLLPEANWKVAVENYLECYHCAVAHPSFSDVIDVGAEAYRLESHPTFATHYAQARDTPRNGHYDTNGDVEGQFHMIWPSIKVNVMPGRANISIGPLVPVGPDRTDGFLDYFFGADADSDWIADYLALDDQVGAEDRTLVESVQRGMGSGAFEHGRLLLPSEELIGEFQRWVSGSLNGSVPR